MRAIDIFPWNENFNTGLPEVDAQHQKLVKLLNQLASHVAFWDDLPQFNNILDDLADYTVYHFRTEEKIWHEFLPGDEREISHRQDHEGFIRTIKRLQEEQAEKPAKMVVRDALAFLTRWLVSHILESDRKMAYTVQAIQSGLPAEAAKSHAEERISGTTRALVEIILAMYDTLSSNTLELIDELSAHRRMESELALESEKSRFLLRNASDGIHILNREGRILEVSDSFCASLGCTREEALNSNISNWITLSEAIHVKQTLADLFRESKHRVFETQYRRKNGSPVEVEVSTQPMVFDGQAVLFCASRDITERKETEAIILRDWELQTTLRELLEITTGGSRLEELLGLSLDRLLEISWLNLQSKAGIFLMEEDGRHLRLAVSKNLRPETLSLCELVPLSTSHCGRAAATGKVQYSRCVDASHTASFPDMPDHGNYNVPLISEQRVLGVLALYLPLEYERDPNNEQFILSVADILAGLIKRKHAEYALRIAATAFESQEGMVVTDAGMKILRVNKAFTSVTGYTADEAIGQTPAILKSGRQSHEFYREMWRAIEQYGAWQGEIWNRRKSGEVYPEWLTITAVKCNDGKAINYVGSFLDITQRKQAEEQIVNLAFYDALTGLPNRRLLVDRLQQALIGSHRNQHYGAVIYLDMDRFKLLNDAKGHGFGDKLLIEVGQRLKTCISQADTVSRVGGDEFVVMLDNLSAAAYEAVSQLEGVAEHILEELSLPYGLDQVEYHCTPSIGVVFFHGMADAADDLLKRAELAMYQAKSGGGAAIRFFDPVMQEVAETRASLDTELRQALKQGEFVLHYHPQVDGSGRVKSLEALVRWQHPKRGLVGPAEFIPFAEESGLIVHLGRELMSLACRQIKSWSSLPEMSGLSVSVNVSPRQFYHQDFVDMVLNTVRQTGADPNLLVLEITESLLMDNLEECIAKMSTLKQQGIRFSIDDFGTGYSSMAYLKRLPLDELKIDRSFVSDVGQDESAAAICSTFINLAHVLGLRVVAEGVENEVQRYVLSTVFHCDLLQGYLFTPPVHGEAIPDFIAKQNRRGLKVSSG